jgi:hypothetical protein
MAETHDMVLPPEFIVLVTADKPLMEASVNGRELNCPGSFRQGNRCPVNQGPRSDRGCGNAQRATTWEDMVAASALLMNTILVSASLMHPHHPKVTSLHPACAQQPQSEAHQTASCNHQTSEGTLSQFIQHPVPVLHSRLYYNLTITYAQDQSCSNQEQ